MKQKIVVAVGGNGGSAYARTLLSMLTRIPEQLRAVGIVLTDPARAAWETDLGSPFDPQAYPPDFTVYAKNNFLAPFASGSALYHTMIVCPCPLGLLGRITSGVSDDLITRATDVIIKERRRLIVVPHETPYSLIHLRNMVALTEAGGIVAPAVPDVRSPAASQERLIEQAIDQLLSLAGLTPPPGD